MARVQFGTSGYRRALDGNGDPISGAKMFVYEDGTTTEVSLTSDLAGSTAITQPVVADSEGRWPDVYLDPDSVKVVVQDASDVTLYTQDNVQIGVDTTGFAASSHNHDTDYLEVAGDTMTGTLTADVIDFASDTARNTTRTNLQIAATISDKASAYTALATDRGKVIRGTSAFTLTLTAAATLGSDWDLWVLADGAAVTIDPNGSETIDGASTLVVSDGQSIRIVCDGTSFYTIRGKGSATESAAKVWARYELDTTEALEGSFNVSSITRDSAGNADLALTNAFDSTNDFAGAGSGRQDDTSGTPGAGNAILITAVRPETTSLINVVTGSTGTSSVDGDLCFVIGHGNLA